MKKVALLTLALFLICGMSVFAKGGQAVNQVRLATGGNTGTYYAYGTVLAQILQE